MSEQNEYSSDLILDELDEIPERDEIGRAFDEFERAIWRERGKRTKDARRGAWHCPKCEQPLALSFSDYGTPLWVYAGVKFSNAIGDESQERIFRADAENSPNPTGKDARLFGFHRFPALILCSNPTCDKWRAVPREAQCTGSKKYLNGLN